MEASPTTNRSRSPTPCKKDGPDGPVFHSDIDSILKSFSKQAAADNERNLATSLRKYDEAINDRLAVIDSRADHQQLQINSMASTIEEQGKLLQDLSARLGIAESHVPIQTAALDALDDKRDPDNTVGIVRTSESCKKDEIMSVFTAILGELKLPSPADALYVSGRDVGKKFTIGFKAGTPGLRAERMHSIFSYIRNNGNWRELSSAAGHKIFLDHDKSPHQERIEMAGRRLCKHLNEIDKQRKWFFDRATGVLSTNFKSVIKIITESPDSFDLQFNYEQSTPLQLDTHAVRATFLSLVSKKESEGIQWLG